MGSKILNVAVVALLLVGVADLVIPTHVDGTKALVGGITGLWKTTVNGALGSASA